MKKGEMSGDERGAAYPGHHDYEGGSEGRFRPSPAVGARWIAIVVTNRKHNILASSC